MLLAVLLLRSLAALAVVWALTASWRWLRAYRHFRRLELAIEGPASLPLLGNAPAFLGLDHRRALSVLLGLWGGRDRGISRASIFNRLLVFATHPDDIARVIQDKEGRFNDKPWFLYGALTDFLGLGSVTANGAAWKAHRAMTQPSFNAEILDGYVEYFNEESQEFIGQMRRAAQEAPEGVFPYDELHGAMARSAVRATLSTAMQPGDRERVDFVVGGFGPALLAVAKRTYNVLLWPAAVFNLTATARAQRAYNRDADAYTLELIARRAEAFKEATVAVGDGQPPARKRSKKAFLDHVVEAKLRGQVALSDAEIVGEVKNVFFGAIETSTTTCCFAMKALSLLPDVQERAYREVRDMLADHPVTAQDLTKLVYLESVVKETLRLFPPVPVVARAVREETDFNGKVLPAGSTIIINILGAQRHRDFYEDPLRFDPDRFDRDRADDRHPFSFLPFSAGPRYCVGQKSAMRNVKTVLANTLRAFRIEPVDDGHRDFGQFPLTADLVLRFVGGIRVKLVPRQ